MAGEVDIKYIQYVYTEHQLDSVLLNEDKEKGVKAGKGGRITCSKERT